jgi:DNA-binding LacI/PurR family transcriptional regulator
VYLDASSSHILIYDETRQRILDAIDNLDYQTNMIARRLRTQVIAVTIGDISGDGRFFQSQWQLVERESVRRL